MTRTVKGWFLRIPILLSTFFQLYKGFGPHWDSYSRFRMTILRGNSTFKKLWKKSSTKRIFLFQKRKLYFSWYYFWFKMSSMKNFKPRMKKIVKRKVPYNKSSYNVTRERNVTRKYWNDKSKAERKKKTREISKTIFSKLRKSYFHDLFEKYS